MPMASWENSDGFAPVQVEGQPCVWCGGVLHSQNGGIKPGKERPPL